MSKMMRVVVLATSLLSLFAITAASAGAVTWDVSGATNFTTSGGPFTYSGNGFSLTCSSSDGTGDAPQGAFTAPALPALYAAARGTLNFTGCRLGGVVSALTCAWTLTTQSQVAGSSTVNGFLDVTCNQMQGVTKVCHFGGSTFVHYVNPVSPTPARLTMTASSTLVASHGTVDCPLVATPATSANIALSEQTLTVTSGATGPTVHRTA